MHSIPSDNFLPNYLKSVFAGILYNMVVHEFLVQDFVYFCCIQFTGGTGKTEKKRNLKKEIRFAQTEKINHTVSAL